jgi:Ca-activated chloride channel homolog
VGPRSASSRGRFLGGQLRKDLRKVGRIVSAPSYYSNGMLWPRTIRGRAVIALFCCSWQAVAQAGSNADQSAEAYSLQLSVDEVVLTFHATDARGLPINDLKLSEIKLFDNGAAPRRIVAFDSLIDRPLRAGILLDTSESMQQALAKSKSIAEQYAERLFRQKSDQAFLMDFGYSSEFALPFTNDPSLLSQSIRNVKQGKMNPLGGTAIFDAIFRACYYGFGKVDATATGNFILLFSDGEGISSHTSLEEALGACQRSNTVIYAFRIEPDPSRDSTGPRLLADLASKTGGHVFSADGTEDAIWSDLKTIESEMRNQYRLVYNPSNLKHDGSFHEIELQRPDRVDWIDVRSGYYAPVR